MQHSSWSQSAKVRLGSAIPRKPYPSDIAHHLKKRFSQSTGSALNASPWKKAKSWDSVEMRPNTLPLLPKKHQLLVSGACASHSQDKSPSTQWVDLDVQLQQLGAVWWHKTRQGQHSRVWHRHGGQCGWGWAQLLGGSSSVPALLLPFPSLIAQAKCWNACL